MRMTASLKTPVAFIIFNRPKCTRKVFARIRDARPEKLYLIADAPRAHKPAEAELCAETRKLVEDMIDWPCEVHKNYAEENIGCRGRVASGISRVFEQEETAIILEDDCLPDPSFFTFCDAMLGRYKDDPTVVQVCGTNLLRYRPRHESSYFFSRYGVIWGWATWRDRWTNYDPSLKNWPEIKEKKLLEPCCLTKEEYMQRVHTLDRIHANKLDTWDYQWSLVKALAKGKSIVPSRNLIKNIGFGSEATHTVNPFTLRRFSTTNSLNPPYMAPSEIPPAFDETHDRLYCSKFYSNPTEGIKNKILDLLKK
jgi:hypothetical protein